MPGYIRVGNLRANAPKSRKPKDGEIVIRFDRAHPILGNKHILYDAANSEERAQVIAMYKKDLEFDLMTGGPMSQEVERLANRVEAGEHICGMCWCSPLPCHVELIIDAVNAVVQSRKTGVAMGYKYFGDHDIPDFDETFVFGSNMAGRHGKGAALAAKRIYGAQQGVGEGPTGRAYALPTKDVHLKPLSLAFIRMHVDAFKTYAMMNRGKKFFVTRVGCGLAGYDDSQISPMFKGSPPNCRFHINWKLYLE